MLISKQGSRRLLLIFIFQLNSFSSRFMFICWYFWHYFIYPQNSSYFMLNHLRLIFLFFLLFILMFFMYVNWILGFMKWNKVLERCGTVLWYLDQYICIYLIVPSCIIEICLSFSAFNDHSHEPISLYNNS